jgi:hypothetical protein
MFVNDRRFTAGFGDMGVILKENMLAMAAPQPDTVSLH